MTPGTHRKTSERLKLLPGSHTTSVKANMPKFAEGFEKRITGLHETMQQYLEKLEAIKVSGRYSQDHVRRARDYQAVTCPRIS